MVIIVATINSGIKQDSQLLNLKEISISDVKQDAFNLLVPGEEIIAAFKTVRDQVLFTTKRIFVINVQGITGKKTSFISYPYSKVQYYGIETAGLLDIDSELFVTFSNGGVLQFDFKSRVDIKKISALISNYIL